MITRRIPLGRTIHSVAFDAPTGLLVVMTSYKVVAESHYYQVDLANNAAAEEPKPESTITDVPRTPSPYLIGFLIGGSTNHCLSPGAVAGSP